MGFTTQTKEYRIIEDYDGSRSIREVTINNVGEASNPEQVIDNLEWVTDDEQDEIKKAIALAFRKPVLLIDEIK